MALSKCRLSSIVAPENILNTTKMFFGTYLCRAEFNVNAARLIYDISDQSLIDFSSTIQSRRNTISSENGEKYSRRESDISTFDVTTLFCINSVLQKYADRTKVIIRGAVVRVYLLTETELVNFVDEMYDLVNDNMFIVHRPANEKAISKLKNNVIFVDHPKYGYKVSVREGKYDVASKHRLVNYLSSVDPANVYLTPHFKSVLSDDSQYVYGSFYVNDPGITLFTTLIDPTFINKIYKLEDSLDK